MARPFSKQQRHQWKKNILNQLQSGLSVKQWCHENDIKHHVFYYWKQKLFPKSKLNRSDFTELVDKKNVNILI